MSSGFLTKLDEYFEISKRGSDFATEIRGGVATFMTMSYIAFVNPAILAVKGAPIEGLFIATVLITALVTCLMGIYGKYPYAIAPGMGLNAFVAFGLVLGLGLPWQAAMAVIFWEGLLITILVILGLRERVMDALPDDLKRAIAVGIGAFIAFIGFVNAKLVLSREVPPVSASAWSDYWGYALIALFGLSLITILWSKGFKGSILVGILASAALADILSLPGLKEIFFANVDAPVDWGAISVTYKVDFSTIGALFAYDYLIKPFVESPSLIGVVIAVMLSDFFDTMGTITGIGEQGGFIDESGRHRNLKEILIVDSLGAMLGGVFGTSSATTYIESAAGVAEDAKTGFASVVTALLFLVTLVALPVIYLIPGVATAPALIFIGFLMMMSAINIKFSRENAHIAIAAFVTIFFMPFTYSIASGIALGLLVYVIASVLMGKAKEIDWTLYVFAIFFIIYFIYLP